MIANPVPVVVVPVDDVPVVVVPVPVEVVLEMLDVDTRSISEPRPRTTPDSWVAVVFVPNPSMREMVTVQSESTV